MVDVRLFADLAEAADDRVVAVDVPADATVGAALDALREQYPAIGERLFDGESVRQGYTVAVDGETVEPSAPLAGDELAVFPPVTGG
ncbi:MAG: ubiquitin-like small modifier protein 1 [Haloferacaceae archaeon]